MEARTIRQATGAAEFCEMFLTDVEIPLSDLVGEENDGWKIAQSTLSAERGLTQLEQSERMAAAMSMVEALSENNASMADRRSRTISYANSS